MDIYWTSGIMFLYQQQLLQDYYELVAEMQEERAKGLLEVYPESLVEISPEDAIRIGINGNKMVRVFSRRGEMIARSIISDRVSPGLIFGNFHFPGKQNVNNLTIGEIDPIAKIPEYKVCAVNIECVEEK